MPESALAEGERRRKRRRWVVLGLVTLVAEAATVRARSGRIGGNLIVRCRAGHLFTTLWIPGASVKALRLGPWRLQRCPVAGHWSLVTPIRESELSEDERQEAHRHRNMLLP